MVADTPALPLAPNISRRFVSAAIFRILKQSNAQPSLRNSSQCSNPEKVTEMSVS
jgi:hypothetical protein